MIRSSRQSKILELIFEQEVETQDELAKLLNDRGYNVTQATVSRDIKELGLIKALSDKGIYRYVTIKDADVKVSSKLINVLRETVISMSTVVNFVVIRTLDGSSITASTILGQLAYQEILGKVEGNDTVLLITSTPQSAQKLYDKIDTLLK